MAAEPLNEPDLDTLARHVLPGQIAGVAYDVSLVHADTQAIRRRLDEVAATQGEHTEALSELRAAVQEVLRRLPAEPDGS
jgi:hypothetical protein